MHSIEKMARGITSWSDFLALYLMLTATFCLIGKKTTRIAPASISERKRLFRKGLPVFAAIAVSHNGKRSLDRALAKSEGGVVGWVERSETHHGSAGR